MAAPPHGRWQASSSSQPCTRQQQQPPQTPVALLRAMDEPIRPPPMRPPAHLVRPLAEQRGHRVVPTVEHQQHGRAAAAAARTKVKELPLLHARQVVQPLRKALANLGAALVAAQEAGGRQWQVGASPGQQASAPQHGDDTHGVHACSQPASRARSRRSQGPLAVAHRMMKRRRSDSMSAATPSVMRAMASDELPKSQAKGCSARCGRGSGTRKWCASSATKSPKYSCTCTAAGVFRVMAVG